RIRSNGIRSVHEYGVSTVTDLPFTRTTRCQPTRVRTARADLISSMLGLFASSCARISAANAFASATSRARSALTTASASSTDRSVAAFRRRHACTPEPGLRFTRPPPRGGTCTTSPAGTHPDTGTSSTRDDKKKPPPRTERKRGRSAQDSTSRQLSLALLLEGHHVRVALHSPLPREVPRGLQRGQRFGFGDVVQCRGDLVGAGLERLDGERGSSAP